MRGGSVGELLDLVVTRSEHVPGPGRRVELNPGVSRERIAVDRRGVEIPDRLDDVSGARVDDVYHRHGVAVSDSDPAWRTEFSRSGGLGVQHERQVVDRVRGQ